MGGLADPDRYFEHVLFDASPGPQRRVERGPAAAWRQWWEQQAASSSELLSAASEQGFVLSVADLRRLDVSRETRVERAASRCWIPGR